MAANTIRAPFTKEQVESINAYQEASTFHPLTCGVDSEHPLLKADESGLVCPNCGYKQTWTFDWMTDWSWKKKKK